MAAVQRSLAQPPSVHFFRKVLNQKHGDLPQKRGKSPKFNKQPKFLGFALGAGGDFHKLAQNIPEHPLRHGTYLAVKDLAVGDK